jgi:uncharacterized protein (DUF1778 family)
MATSPILSVRVTPDERALLESASTNAHATISEFTRRAALLLAEEELMRRSTIVIVPERWAEVEAVMAAPPAAVPALQELAGRKPAWQD